MMRSLVWSKQSACNSLTSRSHHNHQFRDEYRAKLANGTVNDTVIKVIAVFVYLGLWGC